MDFTKLVNVHVIAKKLGVHYQTVYRWVHDGTIPFVRVGGRFKFDEKTIEKFFQEKMDSIDSWVKP